MEPFLAQVDLEEVLDRLALFAQHLITAAACLDRGEVVLPGGEGATDLASSTLLKFIDPNDSSVQWSPVRGEPTTAGVVSFLREVLRRDFIDLKRSKRATTTVYVEGYAPDESDPTKTDGEIDMMAQQRSPELETIELERVEWLLRQFNQEPGLLEILRLQLGRGGYNGYSNQELSRMLGISVAEVENRKKRLKLRLRRLASSRTGSEAQHA